MNLSSRREWWERTPRYVEVRCLDCPRTFEKDVLATKQIRCPDCALARRKARAKEENAYWRGVYRKNPCRSLENGYRREKYRLTRERRRLESVAAVNPNQEATHE